MSDYRVNAALFFRRTPLDSGFPVKVEMSATDFQWVMWALEFAVARSEGELHQKLCEISDRVSDAAYQSREG
jgi:hypothetical protein